MSPTIPVDMDEWSSRGPLRNEHLETGDDVQALAERLSAGRKLLVTDIHAKGVQFKSTSYVGRVQVGRFQVTVHPKLRGLPLLNLLRYAYGLRNLTLHPEVLYEVDKLSLTDLLLHQLLTEARELAARGLQRQYLRREEELAVPRGRISMSGLVRSSATARTTVSCAHFPRIEDTPLNRVLLAGLILGAASTDDPDLRTDLRRLASQLRDAVSLVRLDTGVVHRVMELSTRLTRNYEPALRLIEMLLQGMGLSIEGQVAEIPLSGFLFDMNRFFQALVARFLNEHLRDCRILEEYTLRDLIRYGADGNPRRRLAPRPRPDFAIIRGNGTRTLIDTKYRDLWENPLPRDMLYQLMIYAMSNARNTGEGSRLGTAIILYPVIRDAKVAQPCPDQRIEVVDPVNHQLKAQVVLRAVNLLYVALLLTEVDSVASWCLRQELASWLVREDTTINPAPAGAVRQHVAPV